MDIKNLIEKYKVNPTNELLTDINKQINNCVSYVEEYQKFLNKMSCILINKIILKKKLQG